MRKIAVVGSRAWYDRQAVIDWLTRRYEAEGAFIIVSGGADGANTVAEQHGQEMGLAVISFRPKKLLDLNHDPQYGVDEWRLYKGAGKIIPHYEPTWGDWKSAAFYRSLLIVARADEGVAFWDGHSPGTSGEIDSFKAADKPLEIIKP